VCTITPHVAGEDITLEVQDDAGTRGESGPYTVLAGPATTATVDVRTVEVVAGTPVSVYVPLLDAWGNTVDGSAFSASDFSFDDLAGPVACVWAGLSASLIHTFECDVHVAQVGDTLSVALPDAGIAATSAPFDVVNGPLATVALVTSTLTPAAGDVLTVDVQAFDAFANPYAVMTDPVIDLADTSDTLSLTSVTLGSGGAVSESASFTRAGVTEIVASQGGVELGHSSPLSVSAGAAVALNVGLAEPWGWTGVSNDLTVQAIDPYGNAAAFDGIATVSSSTSSIDPFSVTLIDGSGAGSATWAEPNLTENLEAATETGLTGTSTSILIVEACAAGPEANIAFGGYPELIACFDEVAGQALVSASLAGSTRGAAAITTYALIIEGSGLTIANSAILSTTANQVGALEVRALAADALGCGDEVQTMAWVGPDDGEPVGRLTPTLDDATLVAGLDATHVEIEGAVDCSRDPAAGGSIHLWTDRGVITGAAESGYGLSMLLDPSGDGVATLDLTGANTGGSGTVHAWVDSGAALGTVAMDVTGDDRKPIVWDQDPQGDLAAPVTEIRLQFSEPMRASTVIPGNFQLSGPSVVSVTTSTLEAEGDAVVLALDAALDPSLGVYTLVVSSSLRDDAQGNRLDGTWTGVTSNYEGHLGDLPSAAPPIQYCSLDTAVLRPDGDAGADEEADEVTLAFGSSATPDWWVVSVKDEEGKVIFLDFAVPIGSADVWTWNARDVDEQIVSNGLYTISVDSDDGFGNRGGGCSASIAVDNRLGE
jgi:hypothetical protein